MAHQALLVLFMLLSFSLQANKEAYLLPDQKEISFSEEADMLSFNTDHLTDLEAEPSALVYKTVNVISGSYSEAFNDFVAAGPEPIVIQRVYSSSDRKSGSLARGWHYGKYGSLHRWKCKEENKEYRATVTGGGGVKMTYCEGGGNTYSLHKRCYERGFTNTSTGILSARTLPMNDRLSSDDGKEVFTLKTAGGGIFSFVRHRKSQDYCLKKEEKPNCLHLLYDYDSKRRLSKVCSVNQSNEELASVSYTGRNDYIVIAANGAAKVTYKISNRGTSSARLKGVKRPSGYWEWYDYKTINKQKSMLGCKRFPGGRNLEIDYFKRGSNLTPNGKIRLGKDDPRNCRVKALYAPVGRDHLLHPIYEFIYKVRSRTIDGRKEIVDGDTCVYDAYKRLKRYYYNVEQRLTMVNKYTGVAADCQLYTRERLFWSGSFLVNRILLSKEGTAHFCKQYLYDAQGSVRLDALWGNLSGYNVQPVAYSDGGFPEHNGCEHSDKVYTYTEDGLNLMSSFTENDTVKTVFRYVSGTSLLEAKFSGPIGSCKRREFFEYDNNSVLVRHIQDDGCSEDKNDLQGVTERHIKIVTPTKACPIGLPETVELKYLDLATGEERLKRKIFHVYTPEGWVARTDTYGADNTLSFSERWEYDAIGNVTLYEDALARIFTKKYDANGNLIYEQGPRNDVHVKYAYDFSNRLVRRDIIGGGLCLAERHFYDLVSNRIASEDIYGNRTEFVYDEFGRRTTTTLPAVEADGAISRPQTSTHYNELDHPLISTDAKGLATHKSFTVRGAPYHVMYPDGSQESFVYNLGGTTQRHTHKNGSYTLYAYDYQKREVSSETYSVEGELLDAVYKEYSGFNLLRQTTLGGSTTTYHYDYAGLLTDLFQDDARTSYVYDSLGRCAIEKNYYGLGEQEYVANVKVFDCLNRVVEEREEASDGSLLKKTQIEYDIDGNRSRVIELTQEGEAVTTTSYDCFGQPLLIVDSLGRETRYSYAYDKRNELGQNVAYQEVIDPQGITTAILKDALGRVVSTHKKNSLGQTLHATAFYYDVNGNKVRQVDTAYAADEVLKEVTLAWEYDACNREVATIEAVGTPEQKAVHTEYNLLGEKEKTLKPNGVFLAYTYDALGRLATIVSSDYTVSLRYTYDSRSNPIRVDDAVNKSATLREYDLNNRLSQETLGNGITLLYTYDTLGRPTTAALPDGSFTRYHYEASRLKSISRVNSSGQTFTHDFLQYGYGNMLLQEKYAGQAGEGCYSYDILGRPVQYISPQFEEHIEEYDLAGNILRRSVKDHLDQASCRYAYDDLSQLVEESGMATHEYSYDSLNNRLSKNGSFHQLNSLNQLLHDGKCTYAYDLNGNMTSKSSEEGTVTCEYDAFDRLMTLTKNDLQYRYAYDELHRRLTKMCYARSSDGWQLRSTQKFIYQGQNEVGSTDGDGRILEYRTLGVGRGSEAGATVLIETDDQQFVPVHDHIGNISSLINCQDGTVAESYRYSAFGEETVYDADGNPTSTPISAWRFSGKRVDTESDFVYFGRRYYAADIGRWITADPLGFTAGINLYAYVLNAPLTKYDPYGLCWMCVLEAIGYFIAENLPAILEWGYSVMQEASQAPGVAIERASFHLVPIPVVQDALRAIGTLLQGKCLCNFKTWADMRSYCGEVGGEERDPNNPTVLVNGIMTSEEEMIQRASAVSAQMGGYKVHYCYNASHGFLADLLECGAQKLGFHTHSEKMLAEKCSQLSSQMGGRGKINLYAHSQGGLITSCLKNCLPDSVRQNMVVNTFGSATQISNGDFGEAYNYVSSRDLVPWLDPIGMLKGVFSPLSNTTILSSSHLGVDHSWDNDAYQKAFNRVLQDQNKEKV